MKWLILGALLGLLLTIPAVLAAVVSVVVVLVSQPLLVVFVLGAVARPYLPVVGRWTR
ncbi:hypothetical protein N4P33_15680 [Streptomyces sp. 15-116A]|uniref:hypothetical protein n=1 Tax=Streptomyces sp. 15-116A TaxID=2259035 RepID=UPI0021B327D9|nr:hypothetical protein [Streptomyces sp. 15-116A]MCT7353602.1 hypothetical protein [Streptomyces sp. 15-116A]